MGPDLQDLVDEAALVSGAPATLEDREFNLVAVSAHHRAGDAVRQDSIMHRRSTPEVRRYFESFGIAHAVNNVGTVIRAMERSDLPVKVVSQSLKKNLFWLVTKPEVKSLSELKGKLFGTTTFGGSQHLAALRLLQKAGLDPDKDITVVIGGDVPAQLQSLVSGVIQLAALSPPTVILARDKFKMKIHGSTLEDVPNLQNGLAFSEKMLREKRDLVKRILRARSRAHRYFWENERGTAEVLANYLKVELPVALESYRLARPAFTANGLVTDREIDEFLRADAEALKLREPALAAKIFDFGLQREVNQELGIK